MVKAKTSLHCWAEIYETALMFTKDGMGANFIEVINSV